MRNIHTLTQEKSLETTVSLETELFIECALVPSLGVADRREFTPTVVVHMPPWRNLFSLVQLCDYTLSSGDSFLPSDY